MKKILKSVFTFFANPWVELLLCILAIYCAVEIYISDGFILDHNSVLLGFYGAFFYFCLTCSIDGFIHDRLSLDELSGKGSQGKP